MSDKTGSGEKYHRELFGVGEDSGNSLTVDIYSILFAYDVDPAMDHAVKKLLCPGARGHKDSIKDKREAIRSIERSIELELAKQARPKSVRTLRSGPGADLSRIMNAEKDATIAHYDKLSSGGSSTKKITEGAINTLKYLNKRGGPIAAYLPNERDVLILIALGYVSVDDMFLTITQSGVNFLRSLANEVKGSMPGLSANYHKALEYVAYLGVVFESQLSRDDREALISSGYIHYHAINELKLTRAGREYLKKYK